MFVASIPPSRRKPGELACYKNGDSRPGLLLLPAAILSKLAKHLALIACLLIVEEASGRAAIGAVGIFFLVLAAVILHRSGDKLQRRQAAHLRLAKL
jgi:hypothetical protein